MLLCLRRNLLSFEPQTVIPAAPFHAAPPRLRERPEQIVRFDTPEIRAAEPRPMGDTNADIEELKSAVNKINYKVDQILCVVFEWFISVREK